MWGTRPASRNRGRSKAGWDALFFSRGMTVATIRLSSYFSDSGRSSEHDQLTYYQFLQDLCAHFEEKADRVIENLKTLMSAFFNKDRLVMSLCCDESHRETAEKKMEYLCRSASPILPFAGKAKCRSLLSPGLNEGITTSGKVQYVLAGGNFRTHGHDYTGAMKVLETILRYSYLWTKIRVQGGAYGAGARFDQNGLFYLSSYRDPQLMKTLSTYEGLPEYLEHFEASEREMTKYVIGTISLLDTPLTNAMRLEKAITTYLRGLPKDLAPDLPR